MLYALADSLSALGRDREAETYYRQLLRVNPTDVSAFLTYGDLLAKNVIINYNHNTTTICQILKKKKKKYPDSIFSRFCIINLCYS